MPYPWITAYTVDPVTRSVVKIPWGPDSVDFGLPSMDKGTNI